MQPCCEDERNLGEPQPVEGRLDFAVRVCGVCGRRHFELAVDPGQLGITLPSLTGRE